ncbi:bifunctional folylpolyglutamate synthase/dihydrofolate synthase [Chelatococcus asaccharovorans]|uniref:bifunctional folylpolyglutamate synthase/dihydrofolate synthase n=1 Tax=Chelatococcus asaccharovorans TaxID=28210 RepID=UPI00224C760A|nr:folylpolyglutamate synthase/dihydrofolate synthase family protein [Chelatococcus asaccharovorans]CAH1658428.1 Dihydrofolate synthase [Chelatococcus asaccharovorans]CAH1684509.1 Dihydrofolate synthase [Chelatococcus asaccharovorans]
MESSDALLARFLALHPKVIDLSLGRIARLLASLGHPERRLPPTFHVAGTNGKGSTIAFMRAILEAAGLSVHVYTSPHLVRYHERIRIGRPDGSRIVDEQRLLDAFRRCEEANGREPITFFEITTAAAFLLFAESPADALLLEVGLGGEADATNVITDPLVTVVTPVSLDHPEYLGDRITTVAAAKAGIFKPGVPAVIAPQDPQASAVLEARAERIGAPLVIGDQDFSIHEEGGRLVYQDERGLLDLPLPRLAGRHQHINAGTAIAALRTGGFDRLPVAAYEAGMKNADWPARMQRLTRGDLIGHAPEGAEIWLDGGHNPEGGRAIASAMADMEESRPAPLVLIVGMLGTKDAVGFLSPFAGLARELLAVSMTTQLAARPAEEIAEIAQDLGFVTSAHASVEAALASLKHQDWDHPPRILITGSLYFAGEVLAANGTPPT